MLKQYKLRNYHFQLVISILVLNIIGILIIGSAKHSVQKMQILGCIIGMVAMVIVSLMDYSFILRFTWLYYIGIIVLLGLVMTGIGDSAGGAQRWIDFGGFRFQPSELAKIVLILFFARFFSKYAENLNTVKTIGLSFVLIGIPLLLIVKQPDTSTSIAIALISEANAVLPIAIPLAFVALALSPMAILSVPVAVPPPSAYGAAIALPANKTREETRTPLFIALFDFLPFDLVISETATHAPNDSFQITRYTLFITTSPQSQFLLKKLSLLSKKLFYSDI